MINIEQEELLKEALTLNGINIFAGSGFSLLPDENNKVLKNVKELSESICETFSIDKKYIGELDKLSELARISAGEKKFKEFLIKEYTVSSYNKLYDELNKININSFITTNIDNIVHCVIDNSSRYYLVDRTFEAVKRDGIALEYIPLHGCVKNIEKELFFAKTQIASASSLNSSLFEAMRVRLSEKDTLFIGYGFNDSSTDYSLSELFIKRETRCWILCPHNNKYLDYYKKIGAYIINGTTEDFFIWIKDNIKHENKKEENEFKNTTLKKYMIPTINSFTYTKDKDDYYVKGETDWYNILYNHPYKTEDVDTIKNLYLKNKNILVVGLPFSGKTTISMQLMSIISGNKFYFDYLDKDLANLVINNLNNKKAIIVVDNCTDDIYGYIKLALQNNIQIIGFTDNISFESSKFILDNNKIKYYKYDIKDISFDEAQRIYNYIPDNIKKSKFLYKDEKDEKFSMFEMMEKNVKNVMSKERVKSMLNKIKQNIEYGIDIIGLTCYLSKFHSALSTDIMFYYFDNIIYDNKYEILINIVNKVKDFLTEETGSSLNVEKLDQDYYSLRSHIFTEYSHIVLVEDFCEIYSRIIMNLIIKVKPIYIVKYKAFSRKAYDSQLFYKLFKDKGLNIYNIIYENDIRNYYTLQQMALYMGAIGKFREAHEYIDKAKEISPNNYSIKNSRAIILFERNKKVDKNNINKGINNLREAMNILENCHENDDRKLYHSQKYAEFAIELNNRFGIKTYLKQALEWLIEIEKKDAKIRISNKTKYLIKKLKYMI